MDAWDDRDRRFVDLSDEPVGDEPTARSIPSVGPWRWQTAADRDGDRMDDLLDADGVSMLESAYFVRGDDENEANRRLIAAAPDLLAALLEARAELTVWRAVVRDDFRPSSDLDDVVAVVRRAIEKATEDKA